MNKLKYSSVNTKVLFASILSFIWVIVYKFWLIKTYSDFPMSFEIGDIFYQLGNALIASSLFYYMVVYLEQKRIKELIGPVIKKRMLEFSLIGDKISRRIKTAMEGSSNPLGENFGYILDSTDKRLKTIKLTETPTPHPGQRDFANWYALFEYHLSEQKLISRKLYEIFEHLDPIVMQKLEKIENSDFERSLHDVNTTSNPDYTLAHLADLLVIYLNACREFIDIQKAH